LLLLDARAAERYRGDIEPLDPVAGHIPGALNRPYARNVASDGTFRSARELRTEFEGMLHGRPSDDLVHYCGSGISACHNLLAMTIAGYPLTRISAGSWSGWVSDARRRVSRGQV
jgi:thiosulfate/3-mercaptopyruvate sulfurtransferase